MNKYSFVLLEDNESHIELIERAFKYDNIISDYIINSFTKVKDCLDYLDNNLPDLVISDWQLPDGKGIEIVREYYDKLPIVIMTSFGDEKIAAESIKKGALDYIVKSNETFMQMPKYSLKMIDLWNEKISRKSAESSLILKDKAMDSAKDGIMIIEKKVDDYYINYFNKAAIKLLHTDSKKLQNQNLNSVFKDNIECISELIDKNLNEDEGIELKYKISEDKNVWLYLSVSHVENYNDSSYSNYVLILSDITNEVIYSKKLESLNQDLEIKVQQRTEELEAAKKHVENALTKEIELNKLKSSFISMVSHEYRTPLQVITSSCEMAEVFYQNKEDENFKRVLSRVDKSVLRLKNLLEEVLLVEKNNSNPNSLKVRKINVKNLLLNISENVKMGINKNINIEFSFKGEEKFYTDENEFELIFNNLISNAFKYNNTNGDVEIIAENNLELLNICVKDSGIGIPAEDIKDIFNSFKRASNVGTIEGTGLGTYIVKRSLEKLSGYIDISSELNVGTEVNVKLPNLAVDL